MPANNTSPAQRAPSKPTLTLRGLVRPKAAPDVDQFYFNWRVGNRRPGRRFATSTLALAEAARLRAENPGVDFITYYAVAVVEQAVQP